MRLSVVEVSGKRGKGAGDGRMIDGSRVYEEQGTSHLYSTLYILRFILVCKAAYTTLHSLTHRVAARAGPARAQRPGYSWRPAETRVPCTSLCLGITIRGSLTVRLLGSLSNTN